MEKFVYVTVAIVDTQNSNTYRLPLSMLLNLTFRWFCSQMGNLNKFIKKKHKERLLVLKSLSDTKWVCHSKACALTINYKNILTVFFEISESKYENGNTKYNSKVLLKNMLKKKQVICIYFGMAYYTIIIKCLLIYNKVKAMVF